MSIPVENTLPRQRKGIGSTVEIIREDDGWDVDPATANSYLVPLSDKIGLKVNQDLTDAINYNGRPFSAGVIEGLQTADGAIPLNLDFVFIGRILRILTGSDGYSQPEGATGKLHEFVFPLDLGWAPDTFQVVRNSNEATALLLRTTGHTPKSIHFPFSVSGQAKYELVAPGSGKEFRTLPAGYVAHDDGYSPVSYSNSRMIINNLVVAGLTNFDDTVDFGTARQDVGGSLYAGGLNNGLITAQIMIGTVFSQDGSGIESNFNLYDLADNETEFAIECIYADKKLGNHPTQWLRRRYWVRLSKSSPDFGGNAGLIQEAKAFIVPSVNAIWAPELYAGIDPNYTIGASAKLGIKISGVSGGATIPIDITTGTRTAQQIVDDLNANATFTSGADAYVFLGRPMIVHKSKGTTATLQIDTAQVGSCHAALGFTGTVYAGKGSATSPVPIYWQLYNNLGASY